MAVRKSSSASPRRSTKSPAPVSAAGLPATRAMLGDVRTELLERIDQTNGELRTEIREAKVELRAEIREVRVELRAEIREVKAELSARIDQMGARIDQMGARIDRLEAGQYRLEAGQHEVKAEMARVAFLVEEQNARNKVVLDALVAFIERQDRLEERMDGVEQTVRALAAPPRAG